MEYNNIPQRNLNPNDVLVPVEYEIDLFADGLTTPIVSDKKVLK